NPIDRAPLDRHVSADRIEALAAEQLAGTGDVLNARESVIGWPAERIHVRRSDQTEPGVLRQLLEQEGEVVLVKRDVGIQISNRVVLQRGESGLARPHGADFPREV